MKLILHSFDLQLHHTFQITHGSRDIQQTLIVELQENGVSGYGEATATQYYGISLESLIQDLQSVKTKVESYSLVNPESFWAFIYPDLRNNNFALCALDVAVNDLFGKLKGLPLYKLWNLDINNLPLTNYTIGIASVEKMVEKLKEKPWPIYKVKLGTKEDVAIVKELRKHTSAIFRVDANGAWEIEEAIANSFELKNLGVEFIEQPLRADNWDRMKILKQESALPCIADESCQVETDVEKCRGFFHGVNIKLMKCGGLTPARRMITQAKNSGMKVMVGCMTESSVGIAAIAQLLPLLDYVDMDGALLLEKDIAKGVTISDGAVTYSDVNGTGAELINKY